MTYPGLDAFRLFAFLAVFLYHVDVMPIGYVGVLAFFVLSGFLITPILVEMRRELSDRRFFINFYGRRCLRIFPLYYVYLAGLAGAAALGLAIDGLPRAIQQIGSQLGYALTYSYDFFHASSAFVFSPVLTHFWSLAVEEQFYLMWPLVVFCVSFKRLRFVLLAMIAAGPLVRLVEAGLVHGPFGQLFQQRVDLTIYVLPFSHIDAFAIGGYLALYGRTPSNTTVAAYSALLLAVGLVTERLATGMTLGFAFGYGPFMADSWKAVWAYTALNVLFGWTLLLIRDRAFLRPVMEHRAVSYLGKISYGLYVYHFGAIWLISLIVKSQFSAASPFGRPLVIVAALALTIGVSMISYAVIEAPCLRLKDRYFAKTRGRAPIGDPVLTAPGPFQAT